MSELPTQVNFRNKGVKLCIDHPKEELLLVCKDCDETLVCINCISTKHCGHKVVAIQLLVQEKFNFLQDLNTETKETKIPRLSKIVKDAEITVKELQQGIQLHIKEAEDHGEYLKELIDESTAETVSELKQIKKKILKEFDKFKSESANVIEKLKSLTKESKEATQSDNNVLILDVTCKEISSLTLQDPTFECTFGCLRFIKGSDPESHVKAAFERLVQVDGISDLATVKHDHRTLSENNVISKLANTPVAIKTILCTKQGTIKLDR